LLRVTETHYFLGFDPKLITFTIRGVKFSLGLYIPIIGLSKIYVVVNGEKQRMKYPWQFHDHAIAKRLVATLGGAACLFIAGILVFIGNAYFTEESMITKEEINKHGIYPSDWAKELGFQRGDKIIAVNGKDYQDFSDLVNPSLLLSSESYYTILRDSGEIKIGIKGIPDRFLKDNQFIFYLLVPFEVSEVVPNSPAEKAGIKPGDKITKVNEQPVIKYDEMSKAVMADEDGNATLEVERKGNDSVEVLTIDIIVNNEKRWKNYPIKGWVLGIRPRELIDYSFKKNSFGQAIQKGTYAAFANLSSNIRACVKLINGMLRPRESLSGPIGVVHYSEKSFWSLTGFYSMWYACWNLLPLPLAAFWEIIPLVYEGVTRKRYPFLAFRRSVNLSWLVILGFIVWTFIRDMIKLF
jgi:regulator of sigma E protease